MAEPHPSVPQGAGQPEKMAADTDISPPRGNLFPVVGIGASAGGLEAFAQLLSALPPATGMAFVLVQHLDPLHESLLPELLAPHTSMPVVSVHDELAIEPDHVYVIPPNTSMELEDRVLRLAAREPGLHLPIDIFFRSLARIQGSRAIGIVLSGNASDGSIGVRAIKAECGITFAQSEATARFGGMPRSAISTGAVDYVLTPAEIARELAVLANHPFLVPSDPADAHSETLPEGENEIRRIFALLHGATNVDFSRYKPTTIRRRFGRRMMVLRLDTLADYARYIERHPEELRELYRDLLICVTSFFRDPDSFKALSTLVAHILSGNRSSEEPVRGWIPGCATGEEVYSLAICLFEVLQDNRLPAPVQLFGTDISEVALERARHGTYPIGIEDDVSPERLRRFFTNVDNGYQISKSVREACVFARHDVTRDPPFSNLDVVSCRNVLIYLDQTAQQRVLPVFHYALKPTGLLMLGSAESTAAASDLFVPADQQQKIYARKATPPRLPLGMRMVGPQLNPSSATDLRPASSALELQKRVERLIQSKYSPDAVLINGEFQIIQFRGRTSSYLDPSPGQASLNVLRLAAENLVVPLRRSVQAAAEANAPVHDSAELETAGQRERITLEVTPIPGIEAGERYFLVVFSREKSFDGADSDDRDTASLPIDEHVAKLQHELDETREYLRNLTEQYEAYSEELRAASEEARSANEELQSTNEELRTTKEELQSANEELTTVNEELQSRNQELNATNSDLKNFLSAVTIPILMVDSDLRVRRFNTAAGQLLELGPVDIGRPVGHIRGRIETPRLEQQVKTVVDTLHAITEELQDSTGRWFSLAVRPYRTLDDRIAGAVITLQDIDPLKRGLQAAEEARDYAEGMIETVREPLVVLDSDLRVQRATQAFYDMFLVSREETEGRFFYDLGNGQWNQARLRERIGAALFRSEPFHDFEIDHEFPYIGRRSMRLNGRLIPFPASKRRMLLLSIEDVTERREIAELRFLRLFETAKDGIAVVDVETQTVQDVNPFFLELTGYSREDFVGKPVIEAGKTLGLPDIGRSMEAAQSGEVVRHEDLELLTREAGTVTVEVVGNSYKVGSRPVVQFNIRDVSARKQAAEALRDSEQRFRALVNASSDVLYSMDPTWTELRQLGGGGFLPVNTIPSKAWLEEYIPVEDQPEVIKAIQDAVRTRSVFELEHRVRRVDGTVGWTLSRAVPLLDAQGEITEWFGAASDVTERKEAEEALLSSLRQKDILVREIHHRVKNNLQVIVSLLSLQSSHINDPQVSAAFEDAQTRLRAIARIHERLYASDDLTEVEFGGYIEALAKELVDLHSAASDQIALELDLADMVLDIEQALPLGLLANELILNSLKHGLDGQGGRLLVRLAYLSRSIQPEHGETLDNGWARLEVSDTGPGLPAGLDITNTKSLGLRLVNLLARQLHGRLEVENGPGTKLSMTFPLEMNKEMVDGG